MTAYAIQKPATTTHGRRKQALRVMSTRECAAQRRAARLEAAYADPIATYRQERDRAKARADAKIDEARVVFERALAAADEMRKGGRPKKALTFRRPDPADALVYALKDWRA